jgi:hypothetical protein
MGEEMNIILIPLYLLAIKSILIGGDFNFYYWFKYKNHYTNWYFNRDEYKPKDN